MLQNIFIYWLALLPLVVINRSYEAPKVSIFLVGGLLLAIFWIIRILKYGILPQLQKKDLWFIAWLLILLVAGSFGGNFTQSLIGGDYRHQGLIFFLTLFLIGKTVGILDKDKKLYFKKVIAGALVAQGVIVILQVLTNNTYFNKPLGTLGETNAVAGYLAIGMYFIIETLPKSFIYIFLIPILFTFSRSGIFSYGAFLFLNTFKKINLYHLGIFTVFLFLILGSISLQKDGSKFENRPFYWKIAIEAISKRPIIGYGAESQTEIYNAAFIKYEMPLQGLIIDRAHNLFLDVAIWSGILGLVFFAGWLFLEYKNLVNQNKKAALIVFLIYSFFQPLSVVHWTLLFIILNI